MLRVRFVTCPACTHPPCYAQSAVETGQARLPRYNGPPTKTGVLSKCGDRIKTWHRRLFVLENGELSYHEIDGDGGRGELKGTIPLAGASVRPSNSVPNQIEVTVAGPKKRTFLLVADSADLADEWTDTIRRAINYTHA